MAYTTGFDKTHQDKLVERVQDIQGITAWITEKIAVGEKSEELTNGLILWECLCRDAQKRIFQAEENMPNSALKRLRDRVNAVQPPIDLWLMYRRENWFA